MTDNNLLKSISKLNDALLQPDSTNSVLNRGIKSIAEITGSIALVLDLNNKVIDGHIDGSDTDGYFQRIIDRGSVSGESQLQKLIKKNEHLQNEKLVLKKPTGGEDVYFCSSFPVNLGSKQQAILLFCRIKEPFDSGLPLIAHVGVMMVGMVLLHQASDLADQEVRDRELAEAAFDSLSYSEVEAIREILNNIDQNESIVVASRIADNLGITRSVIVNALRKFESAGIVESRSLGMKGTFIRIKNAHALEIVALRSADMNHIR